VHPFREVGVFEDPQAPPEDPSGSLGTARTATSPSWSADPVRVHREILCDIVRMCGTPEPRSWAQAYHPVWIASPAIRAGSLRS